MPNKPPRASIRAAFDAIPSHHQTLAQGHDSPSAPLRDEDVPDATSQPNAAQTGSSSLHHSSGAEIEPQQTPPRHVHRSLYASAGTIKLIRQIACDEDTSAQALYREGLLLMLQQRGHYRDKTAEDI